MTIDDHATEEARLTRQIEQVVGGTVVSLERQVRWRKAWYAVVDRDGARMPIYVRGDKQLDAEPFPGLDREAAILRLFEAGGLPVPHVYGMAQEPIGIIMSRVAGTRDVAEAADDAERVRLAEQYIRALVYMHRLDTAPFVAAGIAMPNGPVETALAYIRPNEALYRRTRRGAQPLVEFALGWIKRNVPMHRRAAGMIHADPGQFLFENGTLTCLYDFEASHIGDPLADLAALRTRHGTEPLGADPSHLIRYYGALVGEPVDLPVVSYHTASFMLTAVMALAGLLSDPGPAEMQLEYLTWDLTTRRAMLWAMAECMGVTIERSEPVPVPQGRSSLVATILSATIERIEPTTQMGRVDRSSAMALAAWSRAEAASAVAHEAADLDRAQSILGFRPAGWRDADAAIERFVLDAGPEHDRALLQYFARQVEDRVVEAVPIADRLAHYALSPIVA